MTGLRLAICVIIGAAGHATYRPTLALGERWGSMIRYIIGVLLLWPCLLLMAYDDDNLTRTLAMAAGGVGLGTLAGHLFDRARDGE
jgi:hypothetical protein